MSNRVLVSWIGHTDLASMAADVGGKVQQQVTKEIGRDIRSTDDGGPIRALLASESFDSVLLLSSYSRSVERAFQKWIDLDLRFVKPNAYKTPNDYESLFEAMDSFLGDVYREKHGARPTELCIHLSPGTPAMTAIWILLGNSKYRAKFFQSYAGKSSETNVPFDLEFHIREVIQNADSAYEHLLTRNPEEIEGFSDMTGSSRAMKEAVGRAHRVALRDVSVLLVGESGTGKSKIAKLIHDASRRKNKPFKSVNCAAIPDQLLESELFGYEKGAFTGADKMKEGIIKQAHGGTVFLDEIGECELGLQAKLLTVLQPLLDKGPSVRQFRRVGGSEEITADVRIIAATNQNLIRLVEEKRFRLDLYYRLAAITIKLPPLRERGKDVLDLAKEFLAQINKDFASDDELYSSRTFASDAISLIRSHDWPGNARQLYNAILQAVVMSATKTIRAADLASSIGESPSQINDSLLNHELGSGFSLAAHLDKIRAHYLKRGMQESAGVKKKAAELLGFDNWQTMDKQINRLKIKHQ